MENLAETATPKRHKISLKITLNQDQRCWLLLRTLPPVRSLRPLSHKMGFC